MGVYIAGSLVKPGDKIDADWEVVHSGFRKDEEVFNFHITLCRALVQTFRDILAMLLVSTILCAVAW